jgi:hypothetical protein
MSTPSEQLPKRRSFVGEVLQSLATHKGTVGKAQAADRDGDDAAEQAYDRALIAAVETISAAIDLTEIGGGAVASALAAAQKLAAAGKWRQALTALDKVRSDAAKVNARAPFVQMCRRNEKVIKAAFSIAQDGLGKNFKEEWERALKVAEAGDYDRARQAVETLAGRVEAIKNRPDLKAAREQIVEARAENVDAMHEALKASKVDVKALRALVELEIGADDQLSLANLAAQLGDDPGAKARDAIRDEPGAEKLFMENDWFGLKDKLHGGTVSTDQMWDCWRYRQQFVTRLIDLLRQDYPTLIAKTSGSTDLESDIDITFASSAPGDDVRAAKQFNAIVKAQFGKPPGRVFDVNIYPRDYNAINESINPDYAVSPIADRDIDQPTGAMQKLSRVDQDVATLLKQRRFLDDASFQTLMKSVVDSATDEATAKQISKQFEEGEDIFLLTTIDKIDRIKGKLAGSAGSPKSLPLLAEYEGLKRDADKGDTKAFARAQRLLPRVLDELETAMPAEVMEATDEMYLEKMAVLREDQSRIALLEDGSARAEVHHKDGPCEAVHPKHDHESWRQAQAETLKAKVKKDQFTNIVFANEAYMSQGAIEHVVAGIQAKDPVKKEAALAKLTPATLMQSCNEQLADFFKDMKSSEQEIAAEKDATLKRRATGEAFVHASKYLVRLLDAAQLLSEKFAAFTPPVPLQFGLTALAGAASPKELMTKVEAVLLALRKSSTVPADAKGEVGVDEVRTLFKVDQIGEFRKLITAFGAELNQQVRNAAQFKAELAVDAETERQYFGVPALPPDLKPMLEDAQAVVSMSLGDDLVHDAIAKGDAENQLADQLFAAIGSAPTVPQPLATQIAAAAVRIEDAMGRLAKSGIKDVLKRAAGVAQASEKQIKALKAYGTSQLHAAHQGDIDKAVGGLLEKSRAARQIEDSLGGEVKASILSLGRRLTDLKKRIA